MEKFSNQDVIDYYDRTEVHYRMWWRMEEAMGLHYGLWDESVSNLPDAVVNMNTQLAKLGGITAGDYVLDAGCGVGGSAIHLANTIGCKVTGITLSSKQVATATKMAEKRGLTDKLNFAPMDYTATSFPDNTFDKVWGIESIQTAGDKSLFFKEAARVLKPGGKVLMADVFKSYPYSIDEEPLLQEMINGWAMSDLLTLEQLTETASQYGFRLKSERDITVEVYPSVKKLFWIAFPGMLGTWAYMLYKRTNRFAEGHWRTCIAQYFAYKKKLWKYRLVAWELNK